MYLSALQMAVSLLGQSVFSQTDEGVAGGIITETEAYTYYDKACHGYQNKKTKRTEPLFMAEGFWYVYLIYGLYHCVNVTAEAPDAAGAVLIRAIKPTEGLPLMATRRKKKEHDKNLTNGPGKLCQALAIDRSFNTQPAFDNPRLFIKTNAAYPCFEATALTENRFKRQDGLLYETSPRVGIDYAEEDRLNPWRFTLL